MIERDTSTKILEAARRCLLDDGYAALSTRRVAKDADVPLSQIHYHFGSKEELILALLRKENNRLLERQTEMFSMEIPLWKRWEQACDYFDEDIESGYVRVLQEMTAAGWSSEALGKEMRQIWDGWGILLLGVARESESKGVSLGGLTPEEVVALVSASFVGAEAMILLGYESERVPLRGALRKVGDLIRIAEEGATHES
ncbi:MAG: helix-turn-helix domain-containing protein [Acidimicrobiia bacterium]